MANYVIYALINGPQLFCLIQESFKKCQMKVIQINFNFLEDQYFQG